MELTKEYFNQHLDNSLRSMENRIIGRLDEAQEELALMVAGGFEDMQKRLDLTDKIKTFERKFEKLEETLGIKL